jgi:hypothetical protein
MSNVSSRKRLKNYVPLGTLSKAKIVSATQPSTQPSTSIENMTLKEYADKTSARFVDVKQVLRKDDIEYFNDRINDLIADRLKYAIFAKEDLNNRQYLPFINKLKENGFIQVEGMPWVFSKNGINPKEEYARLTTQPSTQPAGIKLKSLVTPESLLAKKSFRKIPLEFVDNIQTTRERPVAARAVRNEDGSLNHIKLNLEILRERYEQKAWTNPAVLIDGSKARPLRENEFKSFNQFLTFVLLHEYKHESIKRDISDLGEVFSESRGQYETRINDAALEELKEKYESSETDTDETDVPGCTKPF